VNFVRLNVIHVIFLCVLCAMHFNVICEVFECVLCNFSMRVCLLMLSNVFREGFPNVFCVLRFQLILCSSVFCEMFSKCVLCSFTMDFAQ
jgi:hypothetical protein